VPMQLYDRRWIMPTKSAVLVIAYDRLARSARRLIGYGSQIIDTHDRGDIPFPVSSWAQGEMMMHRWLLLMLGLAWVLVPATAAAQAAETRTAGERSPDVADVVERLLSHTHAFRQQEGRPPVAPNPELTATAHDFATFMARTGQLRHTADGQTPEARAKAHGYDACLIAENIAYQQTPTGFTAEALAQGFFEGWQHSPDHRQNLLDPAITEIGVGMAQSELAGTYYAVHLFGRPTFLQIEFQITNTSDIAIPYTLDGQTLSLPPQSTHTHQQCRPTKVIFHWPGAQGAKTVHPIHGDLYTIVQGDAGEFRVERG
jgi:uncharacterized protein YkwD